MLRYVTVRLAQMILALVVVSLITFLLMHAAPGDFLSIRQEAGALEGARSGGINPAAYWQSRFSPSIPLPEQYLNWLRDALFFDFGPSFTYPSILIEDMLAAAFPISFQLAILSTLLSIIIGLPLGIVAALFRNGWIDYIATGFVLLGRAFPPYLAAVFLIVIFSIYLKAFPALGWGEPSHYVLPVLALALAPVSTVARYVRAAMIEQLEQDYVRTAWAKGGTTRHVVYGHALRNSLIPVVTVIGPTVGYLMVGSIFVESIFGIPGMGRYLVPAAEARDYPLIMASTLVFAVVLMVMNLLVDLLYFFLNPRLRTSQQ